MRVQDFKAREISQRCKLFFGGCLLWLANHSFAPGFGRKLFSVQLQHGQGLPDGIFSNQKSQFG
jgi:hypothetical protein